MQTALVIYAAIHLAGSLVVVLSLRDYRRSKIGRFTWASSILLALGWPLFLAPFLLAELYRIVGRRNV
jgi:hypothetical protein